MDTPRCSAGSRRSHSVTARVRPEPGEYTSRFSMAITSGAPTSTAAAARSMALTRVALLGGEPVTVNVMPVPTGAYRSPGAGAPSAAASRTCAAASRRSVTAASYAAFASGCRADHSAESSRGGMHMRASTVKVASAPGTARASRWPVSVCAQGAHSSVSEKRPSVQSATRSVNSACPSRSGRRGGRAPASSVSTASSARSSTASSVLAMYSCCPARSTRVKLNRCVGSPATAATIRSGRASRTAGSSGGCATRSSAPKVRESVVASTAAYVSAAALAAESQSARRWRTKRAKVAKPVSRAFS